MAKRKDGMIAVGEAINGAVNLYSSHDGRYSDWIKEGEPAKTISQSRRELARRAIEALFPGGCPDAAELPNVDLDKRVNDWITRTHSGARTVNKSTVLRAAGRRK